MPPHEKSPTDPGTHPAQYQAAAAAAMASGAGGVFGIVVKTGAGAAHAWPRRRGSLGGGKQFEIYRLTRFRFNLHLDRLDFRGFHEIQIEPHPFLCFFPERKST